MGYANQLIGGGDGRDRARALVDAGASGVIVADLTPDEGAPFEAVAAEAGLAVVYLVAPTTRPDRRAAIAARTGGFLYCVSLVGVTGARASLPPSVTKLVREVKAVSPAPVAVGFGVSKPAHVRAIARAGADGVIVASALVDALGPDGRDVRALGRLVALPACGHRPPPRGDRLTDTRAMPDKRIAVYLETTDKKVFACAQDWPGWCRAGKDEELALQALADAAPRYAKVAKQAKVDFPEGDAATGLRGGPAHPRRRRHGVRRPERELEGRPAARRCRRGGTAGGARRGLMDDLRPHPRSVSGVPPEGSAWRRP